MLTVAQPRIDSDVALTAIFEERAENLSPDELSRWSAETDRDRALLTKLKGSGAKLLVVVFDKPGGDSRFALLIEDKIDAPLQPEHERRYRLRADAEILRGDYSDYEVILCSPEAYGVTHKRSPHSIVLCRTRLSTGFSGLTNPTTCVVFTEPTLSLLLQRRVRTPRPESTMPRQTIFGKQPMISLQRRFRTWRCSLWSSQKTQRG